MLKHLNVQKIFKSFLESTFFLASLTAKVNGVNFCLLDTFRLAPNSCASWNISLNSTLIGQALILTGFSWITARCKTVLPLVSCALGFVPLYLIRIRKQSGCSVQTQNDKGYSPKYNFLANGGTSSNIKRVYPE